MESREKRLLLGDADAPATPLKVFASINASALTVTAATMQLILMATTYVTCVFVTKHCPNWFLPTISNTWEAPPGNYLSRWVVSFVCVCINLGVMINYFKTQSTNMKYPGAVAAMAATGVVCLSWVGSICDSKIPSCRGNNDVHTPLAVTFFILFNMYMVLLSASAPHSRKWKYLAVTGVSALCTGFMATSHLAKLGVVPLRYPLLGNDTPIAIVEWSDVILVLVWFVSYMGNECKSFRLGFLSVEGGATESKTERLLAFASAPTLTLVASVLCLGTTLLTWLIAVDTGVVQKGIFPVISDLWWSPPGNWVARWGVVLGATFLYLHEINLYFMNTASVGAASGGARRKTESIALVILGIVGAFGLSVVGCISEKENDTLHVAFASLWFVGYDLYMLIYAIRAVNRKSRRAALASALCFAVSTLMKVRYMEAGTSDDGVEGNVTLGMNRTCLDGRCEEPTQSLFALYEWADMLTALIFINITISLHETQYETPNTKYGVGIYQVTSS